MNISKELMVSLLVNVIATKTMEEKQAAIVTLGTLPETWSEKPLDALLTKMENGKLSRNYTSNWAKRSIAARCPTW